MKKIILLLFLFVFGCDKIPTGIVDNQQTNFQANDVKAPTLFTYSKTDSVVTTSIRFNSSSDIQEIWLDVLTSDDSKANASPIYLFDDGNLSVTGDSVKGDLIYSARVPLGYNLDNGKLRLEYYVQDKNSVVRSVAVHQLDFVNSTRKHAPVISNLDAPDTLVLGDVAKSFTMHLNVADQDGLSDISQVFFITYRPDGTTSGNKNIMYDDGNASSISGDITAGDGIYSYTGQLPPTTTKGTWTFVFRATDKSDSTSNVISHKLYIK